MKKMTLLCTRVSREATLDSLRDLGVVHLQHVNSPEGEGLDQARHHFEYLRRALEVLPKHPHTSPSGKSAHDVVEEVWKLIHRKQSLAEKIELLEIERKRYELFGTFDVDDILALREQGVQVKLLTAPIKQLPEQPEGATLVELGRDRTSAYFVLISREPGGIEAEELPLPECSANGMARHIEGLQQELAEVEEGFSAYVGDHDAVAAIAGEAEDHVVWLEARNGMGLEEDVTYLRGFFPAERETELRTAAEKQGWAVLVEEPAEEDEVPTLLRNPKWVSPIKAVLNMIGVIPGYKELDVSALFLIFLSIFFAFLIGDAGYGLLFIVLTLFGKRKLKGNEAAQPALNLLMLMSTACVVFGVLTGNYFGIMLESLPAPLAGLSSDYLTGKTAGGWNSDLAANHVMFVCFALGTLHLTLAHGWNLIRKINSWEALTDLGWLCSTWSLFSVVLQMVLYMELPSWIITVQMPLLGAGVVLIIISLVLTKSYFGLVTLALDVINNFVDIISYVRLYAVGAASLAIAQAFNGMAMDIGFSGLGALGAAGILFAGHALNIILGAMGVMVHGIRLNTLEFSGHAGVEWAGIQFNPFRKKKETL
ncbi:V-type ATP synthase subunit I [Tichowtungia aerotolerans]|uniref:V-type ATP synthase subunit I n=1 Tax=Tichowtungia aerotolerans TaxID=2697043 RepID=A0A6P1M9H0_9BACT|nr:hypothetical protein [Tichowtungia aerotolerans]QHI69204.1 hypothetical protein GT409_06980 [Tichowtungia aerotolerans]